MAMPTSDRLNSIRVLVVEDFDMVREAMELVLDADPEIALIGAVASAAKARGILAEHTADVVVLDLSLPDLDGDALCRQIRRSDPHTQCLLFSGATDENLVRRTRDCGASGYVAKGTALRELVQLIKETAMLPPPPVALD